MATYQVPSACCSSCADYDGCGRPLCATVSVVWEAPLSEAPLSYTNLTGKPVNGLTCSDLSGGEYTQDEFEDTIWSISLQAPTVPGVGWVAYVTSQTEGYGPLLFANQRTFDTPVLNPLNPTGTYYHLGGGVGDARPTLGTMTVTKVDCPV